MLTLKKYEEIILIQNISNNPNIYIREFTKEVDICPTKDIKKEK